MGNINFLYFCMKRISSLWWEMILNSKNEWIYCHVLKEDICCDFLLWRAKEPIQKGVNSRKKVIFRSKFLPKRVDPHSPPPPPPPIHMVCNICKKFQIRLRWMGTLLDSGKCTYAVFFCIHSARIHSHMREKFWFCVEIRKPQIFSTLTLILLS